MEKYDTQEKQYSDKPIINRARSFMAGLALLV